MNGVEAGEGEEGVEKEVAREVEKEVEKEVEGKTYCWLLNIFMMSRKAAYFCGSLG